MIRLYYFLNNYGDDLSPYIIHKLSGEKIKLFRPFTWKRFILDIMIFGRDVLFFRGFHNFTLSYTRKKTIILAIGSIISLARKNCMVWGSGITYRTDEVDPEADIRVVRGPLALQRVRESGYPNPELIGMGDPALLMPYLYSPSVPQNRKIGIIPHINDFDRISLLLHEKGLEHTFQLISLKTKKRSVEEITDEIRSCRKILSTSLHGIIVAHAYGIPALRLESVSIPGDGSKFADYFLSVGIPLHEPVRMDEILSNDPKTEVEHLFEMFTERTLPIPEKLKQCRKDLLEKAPFTIREEIKARFSL